MTDLGKAMQDYDPLGMFENIYRFPEQMEEAIKIGAEVNLSGDYSSIQSVVFCGMGGSAIGGDIVAALVSSSMNTSLSVIRNYTLPAWVGEETLVICVSYSGNTEETLACFDEAKSRGAIIAGISSGGELSKRLKQMDADLIAIPDGHPPRASLGYLAIPGLFLLEKSGLLDYSVEEDLLKTAAHLKSWRDSFGEKGADNQTLKVAETIYNSIPVIYGEACGTGAVALRWRGQLAENGKMVSFHHVLPEMNHNEIVGYQNNPELLKRLGVIWLIDKDHHERTLKRQQLTRNILGDNVRYQLEIVSEGVSLFERFFYLIYFGDWVSFWVAMLHKTDPSPVEKIDRLKRSLSV